jgi:hypothetical protein
MCGHLPILFAKYVSKRFQWLMAIIGLPTRESLLGFERVMECHLCPGAKGAHEEFGFLERASADSPDVTSVTDRAIACYDAARSNELLIECRERAAEAAFPRLLAAPDHVVL